MNRLRVLLFILATLLLINACGSTSYVDVPINQLPPPRPLHCENKYVFLYEGWRWYFNPYNGYWYMLAPSGEYVYVGTNCWY